MTLYGETTAVFIINFTRLSVIFVSRAPLLVLTLTDTTFGGGRERG